MKAYNNQSATEAGRCRDGEPYYIFVERSDSSVVLFSKVRVPFGFPACRADVVERLKADIAGAVKAMINEGGCLVGRYGTTKRSFYDVENVLFYNIGTANFNHLTKRGVAFSVVDGSEIALLREKYRIPDDYEHYYEYRISSTKADFDSDDLLASWQDLSLNLQGLKPATVWKKLRSEEDKVSVTGRIETDRGDTFAVVLDVEKPKDVAFSIMTAMKPLLDGLICALHHSQYDEYEVKYLSRAIGCEETLFWFNPIEVLGDRLDGYVRKYRDKYLKYLNKYSIKWNPADDRCDNVVISVKEGTDWRVSGKVYSTIKCPFCGSKNLARYIWGEPEMDESLSKKEDEGKVIFGGCVVKMGDPRYRCKSCKRDF